MIKTIALVVVALIAILLIYAATKPDSFLVQRSITISAAPDKIFPLINNLRSFNTWNPFSLKDAAIKIEYQGPAEGVGAAYIWQGKESGAGRMEVSAVEPNARVQIKLNFTKPFNANNIVDFTLVPQGNATQVTWAMHGPMPFISKVMTIFFNMDRMVGGDFAAGLENLKTIV